ncbi:hypothetical protein CEXT_802501 [Caerostris extrusa]|uniref:Uncharacterized protein n=1 Tax=Caerostris extrusa TaxID=172846 RepID=A0AAV4Q1D8_CAEEX|nr:hypothetical protein CEXT_802501 [Caerostris extrusa]
MLSQTPPLAPSKYAKAGQLGDGSTFNRRLAVEFWEGKLMECDLAMAFIDPGSMNQRIKTRGHVAGTKSGILSGGYFEYPNLQNGGGLESSIVFLPPLIKLEVCRAEIKSSFPHSNETATTTEPSPPRKYSTPIHPSRGTSLISQLKLHLDIRPFWKQNRRSFKPEILSQTRHFAPSEYAKACQLGDRSTFNRGLTVDFGKGS